MKLIMLLKYLSLIAGIAFLFIEWKIAVALLVLATVFHVIPRGPNALLSVITGYFIIGGIFYLFYNWRVGVCLIAMGLLTAKFRVWGNRKNHEYYGKDEITNNTRKDSDKG